MTFLINGQSREFSEMVSGASVENVLTALGLKQDRVAVEHNGSIVPRTAWATTTVGDGDKFEIVHFVGGGAEGSLPGAALIVYQ